MIIISSRIQMASGGPMMLTIAMIIGVGYKISRDQKEKWIVLEE
jgi:hypothetical protein